MVLWGFLPQISFAVFTTCYFSDGFDSVWSQATKEEEATVEEVLRGEEIEMVFKPGNLVYYRDGVRATKGKVHYLVGKIMLEKTSDTRWYIGNEKLAGYVGDLRNPVSGARGLSRI